MSQPILKLLDYLQKAITDLDHVIKEKNLGKIEFAFEKLTDFSEYLKELLPEDFTKENFGDFERHMHFLKLFIRKKDFEWIRSNFDDIKEVDFPDIRSKIYGFVETEKLSRKTTAPLSKNIFIVHGRDHKPMKELKAMLKEFGLNPIVLHEQPSGSRTIVEKLEKYSDVGYAFVILTPDDAGEEMDQLLKRLWKLWKDISELWRHTPIIEEDGQTYMVLGTEKSLSEYDNKRIPPYELVSQELLNKNLLNTRARQNVVLEFGYFIGLLGRDRVCCLYKGDIELPSDMHGIVYIPFKESVNEVRDKIVKELEAAGY